MHQTRQLFDGRRLAKDCGRIFSRPGYQQKYLPFADVARNKQHARCIPSDVGNGQCEFGGDTIRHSEDIRARAEASAIGGRWRRRGRSQEDDHGLTFEINEFSVREPNLVEIGLAVFEKRSYGRTHRQTDRQTDRHLSFIYIQAPMPGFARGTTHARCFSFPLHSAAVGSGGETGRLFIGRDYSRKYLKMRLMVGEAEGCSQVTYSLFREPFTVTN